MEDRPLSTNTLRLPAWSLLVPAVGLAMACDDDPTADPSITERVENGVVIVEHPGVHVADTLSWVIDTDDVVTIGVVEGPEEEMIGRLAGAILRPDGSILFADAIAHELRVFDERGEFVRKVGRVGEGPGEYSWLSGLQPYAADSVAVLDRESSRVTILDPDLEFVRSYRPRLVETRAPPRMTSHRLVGFFDDGQALVSDYLNVCGPTRSDGFCEDSVAFFRTDTAGVASARFGRFVYTRDFSGRLEGTGISMAEPHPQPVWVVSGQRFFYGDPKRFEISVYRADGTLERVIRVGGAVPSYTREEALGLERLVESTRGEPRLEAQADAIVRFYQEAPLPDTFPAFSDMLVDQVGNLWVREYLPPGRMRSDGPPRWFVFDTAGHLTHAVRSAPGMYRLVRPYTQLAPRIGRDRILGFTTDTLGVQRLVIYRLRKSGG